MPIRGTIINRVDVRQIKTASQHAIARASKQVAAELEKHIVRHSSRPNPFGDNPSTGGQYPKKVSGDFVEGVAVTGTDRYLTISSQMIYGAYLESGTKRMDARPWATKAWNAKDWKTRISQLARKYTSAEWKRRRRSS
jgi:hypothetical protein